MRICRVPAVIMAVVIGGVGLAACGTSASPSAAGSSAATSASSTSTAASTATSSAAGATTPTQTQSATTQPSVGPTHIGSTPHAPASSTGSASGAHSFTIPAIPGENVVSAWGSYEKIGTARVKVDVCAKQTGAAFAVGAIALVYSASGSTQNVGATDLNGTGDQNCVTNTFILYTAHLKVHAFIGGSNGTIIKTGPVLTIY